MAGMGLEGKLFLADTFHILLRKEAAAQQRSHAERKHAILHFVTQYAGSSSICVCMYVCDYPSRHTRSVSSKHKKQRRAATKSVAKMSEIKTRSLKTYKLCKTEQNEGKACKAVAWRCMALHATHLAWCTPASG